MSPFFGIGMICDLYQMSRPLNAEKVWLALTCHLCLDFFWPLTITFWISVHWFFCFNTYRMPVEEFGILTWHSRTLLKYRINNSHFMQDQLKVLTVHLRLTWLQLPDKTVCNWRNPFFFLFFMNLENKKKRFQFNSKSRSYKLSPNLKAFLPTIYIYI